MTTPPTRIGKTTVAASVGSILVQLRQDGRVVAIDADTSFGKLAARDSPHATGSCWDLAWPGRCPNGHPLGANQVLVGHVACLGHGGGGHTSWHCRTCDAVVYGPALNTHCTALEGPAAVRISTQRRWRGL
jgi:hypothetical protein